MKILEIGEKNKYIFEKNRKSAEKHKPQALTFLAEDKTDPNLTAVKTISDWPGFVYQLEGKEISVTSLINPKGFSRELIQAEFAEREVEAKLITTALLFASDPYCVESMLDAYPWFRRVYVVFPSASYFRTLCHFFDFTDLFKTESFMPIAYNDTEICIQATEFNLGQSGFIYGGLKFFAYRPFDQINPELFSKLRAHVVKITTLMSTNFFTEFFVGEKVIENEWKSLPKFIRYPHVRTLLNYVKDKPVVCVAAGPSLMKNIDFLHAIQNEVFIISAASCLKPLLAKGIKPDFVTILDMQKEVIHYLEGIETSDLNIAIEMSCYWGVMEQIPARYHISPSAMLSRTFFQTILEKMGIDVSGDIFIKAGFTVAFMSIFLAQKMGASRVILLGQDLAYTGAKTHMDGATFDSAIDIVEENGVKYFKHPNPKADVLAYDPVIEVDGFYGEKVYTNAGFDVCRILLEKMVNERKITNFTNCTEGGVYLHGLEHLSLKEAYDKYIKGNFLDRSTLEKIDYHYDFEAYSDRRKDLLELREHYQSVKEIANRGVEAFKIVKRLTEHERSGHKLTALEEAEMKTGIVTVNETMDALVKDHMSELEHISRTSVASYVLFKMMDLINTQEYKSEDFEIDQRNKAALFLSSIDEGMGSFVERMDNLIATLDDEYEKREGKNANK